MQDKFNEFSQTITAIEVGINRGMATSLGKKPRKLPTWDEIKEQQGTDEPDLWWLEKRMKEVEEDA